MNETPQRSHLNGRGRDAVVPDCRTSVELDVEDSQEDVCEDEPELEAHVISDELIDWNRGKTSVGRVVEERSAIDDTDDIYDEPHDTGHEDEIGAPPGRSADSKERIEFLDRRGTSVLSSGVVELDGDETCDEEGISSGGSKSCIVDNVGSSAEIDNVGEQGTSSN